jgi:hypothetical protein
MWVDRKRAINLHELERAGARRLWVCRRFGGGMFDEAKSHRLMVPFAR